MSQIKMKVSTTIMLVGIMMTLSAPVQGQEDEDYISIDCGAPNDYYDDNGPDIYYKRDAGFVDSGENRLASTLALEEDYIQPSKTLRIFPNGTRNCYTLQPKRGKGNKYLIRASFWYGNYDGMNQPPVFHLYIDTNYWTIVNYTTFTWEELIYVAPRDYIKVCLVNIGLGVPYISVLELRRLDDSTYKIPSTASAALYTCMRYNVGSTSPFSFRHPEDDYDRIWKYKSDTYLRSVTNTTPIATPTTTSNNAYKVPEGVLMTALETSNTSEDFSRYWVSEPGVEWYAYFHFAEVQDLNGRVREMDIYMNDNFVQTVSLQNQVPLTVGSVAATGSVIRFKLSATVRSDLPPLLNAFESFKVLNLPSSQTDLSDFDGINAIKTTYGIDKESWQGDPCVPQNMTWEGLICNYDDNAPRITSLNLSSSNLAGTIAPSFSKLTAITSLDLSNNHLIGELPDFFANLSNLRILNLKGNNLNGSIPKVIKERVDSKTLELSWDGNTMDHNSTTNAEKKSTNKIFPIVAPVSGLALLILLGAAGVFCWRIKKKGRHASTGSSTKSKLKAKNRPFSYSEVVHITKSFGTIIGEGGFGKVYLGILDNGDRVAVKMLSQASKQGRKEFEAEAQLLMVTYHRNLVSLVGYCDDIKNMALIYEYMPAGNLREHLSGKSPNALTWIKRLKIAVDAAEGLNYLHHGCKPPIIHRDLKSSNILLNEDMQAKIADFGLSKVFRAESECYISTSPAGTLGYLDPEFQSTGNLSRKSDVYSFGIILFELITGHSAFLRGPNGNKHILNWVSPFIQKGDIESIIDPRLKGQFSTNSAWKVVETAMSCVPPTAIQRPNITDVLQELKECLKVETSGSQEFFKITTLELDTDGMPSAR